MCENFPMGLKIHFFFDFETFDSSFKLFKKKKRKKRKRKKKRPKENERERKRNNRKMLKEKKWRTEDQYVAISILAMGFEASPPTCYVLGYPCLCKKHQIFGRLYRE